MIEHIFRNINDIRVFDIMVEFVLGEEEEKKEVNELNLKETNIIDFDGIMDMLSYKDYKRIEVEDSLDHLVRQKILGSGASRQAERKPRWVQGPLESEGI